MRRMISPPNGAVVAVGFGRRVTAAPVDGRDKVARLRTATFVLVRDSRW